MHFAFKCKNKRMKPVNIFLRRGRGEGRMMEGVNLRYIVSTYVSIKMYPLYNSYMLTKIRKKEFTIKKE
jgi:hypothetical protein